MAERKYTYTLTFRGALSIFSGLGIAGLVDRIVVRNGVGLPYIPGSSIKGRLRFFTERLLQSSSVPDGYRLHPPGQPICKALDTACTLCRLFGNPAIPALLHVGQASPDPPWNDLFRQLLKENTNPVVHSDVEIRPGLAVSRLRHTTLPDHLFFDEAIPPIGFSGILVLNSRVTPQETRFLIWTGTLVDSLGARKAAGRGSLEGGIRIADAGI